MGRKRLPENKKKSPLKLSIKKEIIDDLKRKDINISEIVQEFLQNYIKNDK